MNYQQNNPYMQGMQGYQSQSNMNMGMPLQNNYQMGMQSQNNMQIPLSATMQMVPQPQYYQQSQQALRASQPIGYPTGQYYGMQGNSQNPAMPQMPNAQYQSQNFGYQSQVLPNQMMTNPMSTSAIPQTFLPPLQTPPTLPYIPPPQNVIVGIPIDRTKQNVFTNLYSSMAVLNAILDLYVNNAIDESVKNQIFETQMNVFNINKRVLGIQTFDQLKQFAQTANLDISYVEKDLAATFAKPTKAPTRESMKFYTDLGSKLTEFDNLLLMIETPDDYPKYRYQIQSQLSNIIKDVKRIDSNNQKQIQINIMENYYTFASNSTKTDANTIVRMKSELSAAITDIRNFLISF